jgi:organic radical activating enzyme
VNYDNGAVGWSAQTYLTLISPGTVSNSPIPVTGGNPTTAAQITALIASLQAQIAQLKLQLTALQNSQ